MKRKHFWFTLILGFAFGLFVVADLPLAETPGDKSGDKSKTKHGTLGQSGFQKSSFKIARKAFRIIDGTFLSLVQDEKSSILLRARSGASKMEDTDTNQLKQARQKIERVANRMQQGLTQAVKQVRERGVSQEFMQKMGQYGTNGQQRGTMGKTNGQQGTMGKDTGTRGRKTWRGQQGQDQQTFGANWSQYENYSVSQFKDKFVNILSYSVHEMIPTQTLLPTETQKTVRGKILETHQNLLKQQIESAKQGALQELQLVETVVGYYHEYNKKKGSGAQ